MAFKAWMASPVQMDREGAVLSSRTIQNLTTNTLEYLGFLKLHLGVNEPSLLEYMDLRKLGQFVSFHIAKGNSINTITHHLGTARKVYSYLGRSVGARLGGQLQRADLYTSRLTKQLARIMARPRADVQDLQEAGSWMEAGELVKLINIFKEQTLEMLPAEDQELSVYMARQLHDASLACSMFGFMLPTRLCVLRTLQLPAAAKCLSLDCRDPNCLANRLHIKEEGLQMSMAHFKVNHE